MTKGDVLGALARRTQAGGQRPRPPRRAGRGCAGAAAGRRADAPQLGDRPEQRVPMIAPARAHRRAPAAVARRATPS